MTHEPIWVGPHGAGGVSVDQALDAAGPGPGIQKDSNKIDNLFVGGPVM